MPRSPWKAVIDVDRTASLPPFLQIARSVAADIQRGRLRPGDRLPGSRRLAETLQVHRNTVLAALAELMSEGWVETAPGKGTFVSHAIVNPSHPRSSRPLILRTNPPASLPFALPAPPAEHRSPDLPRGTLNLSTGAPDVRLVPARLIGRAYRRVLGLKGADLLGYARPEGHAGLRAGLAAMLANTRKLQVTCDDIMVTRGSQMALTLAARALLGPGDTIAVEGLGYRPAWEAFRATGAKVVPVAIDADGIDIDSLKQLVSHTKLRAVYVTPHHQYPTTVTLKAARRLALLALAREQGVAIIEDDYDHEFHYDGRPVLPLASADHAGLVIYVGTLSKILAPGLRIGYLVAPPAVLRSASSIRAILDTQGDQATEAAVATLIEDGELERHVARIRRVYANRREILANSLKRVFGDEVEFTFAPGGMALWVQFHMPVDIDEWARRSIQHGVAWHPGRRYSFDGKSGPFARFSFAGLDERELPEAVRRMAAARP
jgi:GntR family transcriptional regulator/MocR family aminotransferase